eukprot:354113-Chlamydomonas_euryale.AAC.1
MQALRRRVAIIDIRLSGRGKPFHTFQKPHPFQLALPIAWQAAVQIIQPVELILPIVRQPAQQRTQLL